MNTTILPDGSAFSTATILSKEEIERLPIKSRPISSRISSKMYHDTWEAIGEASMTFNASAGNEVFNSEQASQICVKLLFKIAEEKENAVDEATGKLRAENEMIRSELFDAKCLIAGFGIVIIVSSLIALILILI